MEDQNRPIKEIPSPPDKTIYINTPVFEVMQIMERHDTRILPVTGPHNLYLGFVTKNDIFNKYRHILMRQEDYME